MSVRVITDSGSCLPADLAERLGITVVDLHEVTTEEEHTTAGLSALELVAVYARQLALGGDEGLVVVHLSRELSSTWSAATTAAGVLPSGLVNVIDTRAIGMSQGAAAMAAARCAQKGQDLAACTEAAESTLERSVTYLSVPKVDALRRSGRFSATSALMSTALAMKPIFHFDQGKLAVVAKARTQTKAYAKLVELVLEHASGQAAFVAIQHNCAEEVATQLHEALNVLLPAKSAIMIVPMTPALSVHAGQGAIAVSVTRGMTDH